MEQRHEAEVQAVKKALDSGSPNKAIAKDFVGRIGSPSAAPGQRFDEHDFALCSRVLSQLILSFFKGCVESDAAGNWFPARHAVSNNDERDTELGALFQIATELAAEAQRATLEATSSDKEADVSKMHRMRALPATLLLDAVRLTPIQQVQHFVPVMQRAGFVADTTEAHQTFTHACRILIDKVAQIEDAALLGSLMRWMCCVLPVDHRPAMNISKVINAAHPPHIEEVAEGSLDSLGIVIDSERHARFWGLQASLQANDVLTSPDRWTQAAAQIETVLAAFAGPVQVDSSGSLATVGENTVAFLTSASLLSMQLPDATFRRQVLSEIMILLYRGTKYETEGKPVPEKMAKACEALLPRVRAALDATGSSGPAFRRALEVTLNAEADFLRWKEVAIAGKPKDAAAAAAIPKWLPTSDNLKPVNEALEFIAKQRRTAEQRRERRRSEQKTSAFSTLYGYHYGEGTLPADGMEGLGRGEDEDRVFDPPLKEDLKRVVDELELAPEEKLASSALFQWRMLRRISRYDLLVYSQALGYSGAQQVEYPACKLLADEDERAKKYLEAMPDPKKGAKRPKGKEEPSPTGKEGTPAAADKEAALEELRPRKMAPKRHAVEDAEAKPDSPAKRVKTEDAAADTRGEAEAPNGKHARNVNNVKADAADAAAEASAAQATPADVSARPSKDTDARENGSDRGRSEDGKEALRSDKDAGARKRARHTPIAAPEPAADDTPKASKHAAIDFKEPERRPAHDRRTTDDSQGSRADRKGAEARAPGRDSRGSDRNRSEAERPERASDRPERSRRAAK